MMEKKNQAVQVGIGVILEREGKILVGLRKGSHSPYYSIPGGRMEVGETFEAAAIREIEEETGIQIQRCHPIGLVNDLTTFASEGLHFISVILYASEFHGDAEVKEPHKCGGWDWVDPQALPEPHYFASAQGVKGFLTSTFYFPTT